MKFLEPWEYNEKNPKPPCPKCGREIVWDRINWG